MPRDVNPFEPWRPAADHPGPDWEQRSMPVPGHPNQIGTPRPGIARLLIWGVLLAGLIIALIAAAQVPEGHFTRVLAVYLALALAWLAGTALMRKQKWLAGLWWLTGGGIAAVLAWWFVPTTGGVSLWAAQREANRLVAALEAQPAEEIDGLQSGQAERTQLWLSFPQFRPHMQEAESNWASRAVQIQRGKLEWLPPGDFAGFRREHWMCQQLASLFPQFQQHIDAAKLAWIERSVQATVAEASPLVKIDPAQASTRLQQTAAALAALGGDYEGQQAQLLPLRKQALQARLEATRKDVKALLANDRIQEAADLARRLDDEAGPEAGMVGLQTDLSQFRESCAFLAELARRAEQPDRQ
jgi:hypothetical protein